jgi:hypothetical protein
LVARSPAETVNLLRSLHRHRDYDALAPYIVAERREVMVDVIKAIDETLAANARLLESVTKAFSQEAFDPFDLSAMANNLGPFSANVRLISQRFKGGSAIVTFQEGENVPVFHAEFGWGEDRWQYKPAEMPACLPGEIRQLAQVLRDLSGLTEGGASYAEYCDALERHVFPQMARVATARDGPAEAVAAGPAEGN